MEFLEPKSLDLIIQRLTAQGYSVVAPVFRGGAIVYDEVTAMDSLPAGWTDEQEAKSYRTRHLDDKAIFDYGVGPYSWKKFLFPPQLTLLSAQRTEKGIEFRSNGHAPPRKYAFFGIHPCDLAALEIQDAVFRGGVYIDNHYAAARKELFIVAVNCVRAGGTCFCASMNTGPSATKGFDIVLTEVLEGEKHFFAADVATDRGKQLLAEIPHRQLESQERESVKRVIEMARQSMKRTLDTTNIKELLYANPEHPRWEEVAGRCCSCANCTLVCPTCFCTSVEDTTDLSGVLAERVRKWDSCFSLDFSYIHGGNIRLSVRSRYRQWMTHKLASWIDQFGTSGCVGCGRCITWCPVGIDITEEAAAIRKPGIQSTHHSKDRSHGKS